MALVKDMAIILRRLDYSETSQVLVVFTRQHGQQRLIARGIKRSTKTRVAVGVDLLEVGQVVFSQRSGKESDLASLTEWRQEARFAHLRTDLLRSYAAQYAAEVTAQLTEIYDPHPVLFDGLRTLLETLADEDALRSLVDYLWLMLREIGLRPDLSRCVACGRTMAGDRTLYFSSRLGGTICRDCEPSTVEKRRIPPGVGRVMTAGSCSDQTAAPAAFDMLDYHITELMGRRPRLSHLLRGAM